MISKFWLKLSSQLPSHSFLSSSHQPQGKKKKGQPLELLSSLATGLSQARENLTWRYLESRQTCEVPRKLNHKRNHIESCQESFPRGEMAGGARWETRPSYEFQPVVKILDKSCLTSGEEKGHPCSHSLKALESDNVLPLSMPAWLMVQRTFHLKQEHSRVWSKQPALFKQSLQVSLLVLMR